MTWRFRKNLAELVYQLRTEADTPGLQAISIALGVVVGCLPVYGLHLGLCIVVAKLLRLSRLKMYLAANLNNPLSGPFLVLAEIQMGGLLRRGRFYELNLEQLRSLRLWDFASDLVLGSLAVGVGLGLAAGAATFGLLRRNARDRFQRLLIEESARPYLDVSIGNWEFVRGKLRHDPVYLSIVTRGWLPSSGLLVDLGCGRGALLALLRTYAEPRIDELRPVGCAPSPAELRGIGFDAGERVVSAARAVGLEVQQQDLRTLAVPRCRCAVLLDVLHYLSRQAQEELLAKVAAALEPGGVLLLREADASRSWRFWLTAAAERLRAVFRGRPRMRFCYRSSAEWQSLLALLGFEVTAHPMSHGTPFQNVLLVASRQGSC